MFDVTALGEVLIDFTPCGVSGGDMSAIPAELRPMCWQRLTAWEERLHL